MAKNNRFKKKALEEEAKNIVSSTPLEISLEADDFNKTILTCESKTLDEKQETVETSNISNIDSSTDSLVNEDLANQIDEELSVEPAKKSTISNKIVIEKEEKIKMTKLGTSIKMNLKKDLDKEAKKYTRTTNNIVNILLDNLYDEKTKTFNLEVDKKENSKITSYHIKDEHYKALEKLCAKSGYNKSEIFNMLIEKGLSNLE